MSRELLKAENLTKYFTHGGMLGFIGRADKITRAVDGVSLSIYPSEVLGLVGESGCGKSTLGRLILALINPTAGSLYFEGQSVFDLTRKEMLKLRRLMRMMFQSPTAALNARMKVSNILDEALRYQTSLNKNQRRDEIHVLLEMVNLPSDVASSYPWQLSGGQRRRIGIARALVGNPKLIVADEPVAALDVSVQAQILNLMKSLQARRTVAYLLISHDLSVIKYMSHRIAVMYGGRIVELTKAELIKSGDVKHPYTKELLLSADIKKSLAEELKYEQEPEVGDSVRGCKYYTRCLLYRSLGGPRDCRTEPPVLEPVDDISDEKTQHRVACHHSSDSIQFDPERYPGAMPVCPPVEATSCGCPSLSEETSVKEYKIPFELTTGEVSKSTPSEGERRRRGSAYFARLFITKGANTGREFELPTVEGTRITIGRRLGSDIHLPYDETVSRVHAAIRIQGEEHKLFDLDSKHGTLLYRGGEVQKKERIERPVTLANNDVIEVGRTQLTYIKAVGMRNGK